MNILVIGSGGREHVLCWNLRQSGMVRKIYCAPGNAGIAQEAECVNIPVSELEQLADFAAGNAIDFTVVGPEAPLCDGVVDVFKARGLKVFGPDKAAAQLEGSKTYAKDFMRKYNIPTAGAGAFSNAGEANEFVSRKFHDGAKGIVVLVAYDAKSATGFVTSCFEGAFGSAGSRVLVEECLFGEEASILALCDGNTIVPLVSSQDHKRALDNDLGPNTGGMGAYSPAPVVDDKVMAVIKRDILDNFLRGVQQEKLYFRGIIFVGIMVTVDGPKALEFNVRFGDPEVQAVLRRMDSDLLDAMMKTADGRLAEAEMKWSDDPSVCVVMASGGYPEAYEKGFEISGLEDAAAIGAVVFHAGTAFKDGKIVNAGGRVLGVTARGRSIREAIQNAYAAVGKIHWKGCFCRRDIGHRALSRECNK